MARSDLLTSIAATICDFRVGELPKPTSEHVDRWVCQFRPEIQVPLLREVDHVFRHSYFSQALIRRFFANLIETEKLVGDDARGFWQTAQLLDVQQQGSSQREILQVFREELDRKYGVLGQEQSPESKTFVYLDDVLFTGARVGNDLSAWIEGPAPLTATVEVVVMASHRFGEWKCTRRLQDEAREADKRVKFRFWAARRVENRLSNRADCEVLWPAILPTDDALNSYIAQERKFPFQPRGAGGKPHWTVFSSEEGRQLLERELLLAGMRIRSFSQQPSAALRPLGFGPFGLGFGSVIATYRNCPNNTPLALWWGDPTADKGHPFSRWYPLLQRRTYGI